MVWKIDAKKNLPKVANSHRGSEILKPPFAILLSMHLISSAILRARESAPGAPGAKVCLMDRGGNGRKPLLGRLLALLGG